MVHRFIFDGEPIPCVRTTRKMLWTPAARRYGEYKKSFADAFKKAMPDFQPLEKTVSIEMVFYRSNQRRVDIDNLIKACLDALQDAGAMKDDTQVHQITAYKRYDKQKPCVAVSFWEESRV